MKPKPTYQKLRGGYYTPQHVSDFLSRWALRTRDDCVLEPSCGDGVFVRSVAKTLLNLGAEPRSLAKQLWAYEIDTCEAALAARQLCELGARRSEVRVNARDFFSACQEDLDQVRFDCVVGNPPFIRYQNFPEDQRAVAFRLMTSVGLSPNRLTNAWVPFVVCSSLRLKPRGRLAMVVPAELLQVNYAAELRLFLSRYFDRMTVVTFRKLAFEDVQQEVVLLLAERGNGEKHGIEVLEFDSTKGLAGYDPHAFGLNGFKSVDHTTEKWTKYFLTQQEIDLLRALRDDPRLTRLGSIADTDIGVVTGMNDFFVLAQDEVKQLRLGRYAKPLISRSNQLAGVCLTRKDWANNADLGCKALLLDLPAVERRNLPQPAQRYILYGEAKKLHVGYKCRIRKLWYVLPSVYAPDAFLLRQIHHYPKLVINRAGATCTDTVHRVRFRKGINRLRVAAAFLNSLTFAFSEVTGRSYGGGILELEPNEADRLPLPMRGSDHLDPEMVNSLVRNSDIDTVLPYTDSALLRKGLGLEEQQVVTLRNIWKKLQQRRTTRRNGSDAAQQGQEKLFDVGREALVS